MKSTFTRSCFAVIVVVLAVLCVDCAATCHRACTSVIKCTNETFNKCHRRCESEKWSEAERECRSRYCGENLIKLRNVRGIISAFGSSRT